MADGISEAAALVLHRSLLGRVLRLVRTQHRPDLTRQAFAGKAHVEPDSISGVEKGHHWPSEGLLAEYERLCGLDTGVLCRLRTELKRPESTWQVDSILRGWEQCFRLPEGSIIRAAEDLGAPPRRHRPARPVGIGTAAAVAVLVTWTLLHSPHPAGSISSPRPKGNVCYQQGVEGRVSHLRSNATLWLFVRPLSGSIVYPQPGAVVRSGKKGWSGVAYFGGSLDGAIGDTFELDLVAADRAANGLLVSYTKSQTYRGFEAMPPGTRSLASLIVTRSSC